MDNRPIPRIVAGLVDPDEQHHIPNIHPGPGQSGSGQILQSTTLQQSGYHNNTAMPSDVSVIESEIIIPPEEPSVFSASFDRNSMPPPSIPDPDISNHSVGSRGDSYLVAAAKRQQQEQQERPLPIRMYRVREPSTELNYMIPPPQNTNFAGSTPYVIPYQQQQQPELMKKVPLDTTSSLGGHATSTVIMYQTGPSNSPLPPKQMNPGVSPVERKKRNRCLCCFMVVLLIILFLIVIALAIALPILRLHE